MNRFHLLFVFILYPEDKMIDTYCVFSLFSLFSLRVVYKVHHKKYAYNELDG